MSRFNGKWLWFSRLDVPDVRFDIGRERLANRSAAGYIRLLERPAGLLPTRLTGATKRMWLVITKAGYSQLLQYLMSCNVKTSLAARKIGITNELT